MLLLGVRAEADIAEHARAAGRDDEVERARDDANELHDALREYDYEAPVADPAPPETLAVFAQAEAELARLDGTPGGELWADVAEHWERLRFPYPAASARLREAEARLAAGGDRAAAAVAIRAAHMTLAGLGAAPLREEAEALAKRARVALEAPADRPFDLTERELTVLERLAGGQTNRQIADDLYLSTRTVDMHVRNLLPKLGAANRVEAANTAHRLGIARDTAVLP
jgi:DNA-binding CsgD family transcriptional regulator